MNSATHALMAAAMPSLLGVAASPSFLAAVLVFLTGVVSPGPSNLAIAATALAHGRQAAVALAIGVSLGSLFWGLLVALGVASILAAYPAALGLATILGGCYLLLMARRALTSRPIDQVATAKASALRLSHALLAGALLHLTNPKAVLVWVSVLMVGLTPASPGFAAYAVIACCSALGTLVFIAYALLFSTARAARFSDRQQRRLQVVFGVVFALAGLTLLGRSLALVTS